MSNWKLEAKNLIAQSNLLACIDLLELNKIDVGSLKNDAKNLEAQREKHVENKTKMTSIEINARLNEFERIGRALIAKINAV